jgi:hypothetical protein
LSINFLCQAVGTKYFMQIRGIIMGVCHEENKTAAK